jgi:hypothetical protein
MKNLSIVSSAIMAIGLFMASTVHANLIVNGGFEDSSVAHGKWRWFKSSDVNGWGGSNIEVWDHLGSVKAYEGSQHAELNAHAGGSGGYSIYQTFATDIGNTYDLSFAYGARVNDKEAFRVEVIGSNELINDVVQDHTVGNWSKYINSFIASSTETTLRFTTVTPGSATLGNFLDDIYVGSAKVHAVPELSATSAPLSILLIGSLLALGIERRKKRVRPTQS